MEGIAHIISSYNASWSGWVMLFLLLFAIVGEYMQPGIITQAYQSLRPRIERVYKDAPNNILSQILITFFRIGTLAMALCLCFAEEATFSFAAFAAVSGLIVAVLMVKMLCNALVDYTFILSRRFMPIYEHYANIFTLTTCILYPCLLVLLRVGNEMAVRWVLGIVTIFFVTLWIYRSARTFIQSPLAIIYFLLYIVTLEVLPIGALLYFASKTITLI